ncbi:MAG: acyl carrier protein [Ruminococcaceae bacterium]|jgi:acyl carrier protein|nr:acyl carrier protein [Oscillospiraceae bacterium]
MTRQEILDRTIKIVRDCVPELEGVELREDTVVNTDMGMDSMNFILVICKLEAEFDARIPNRLWSKLSTLGEVVDAIEKYRK